MNGMIGMIGMIGARAARPAPRHGRRDRDRGRVTCELGDVSASRGGGAAGAQPQGPFQRSASALRRQAQGLLRALSRLYTVQGPSA